MIKLLVERDRPPTFNLASDKEVAWHARISVNAIAELAGRYHWLCTYATEEKLFSVIVVDDEATYDAWVQKTNAYTAGLKIRRIVRVLRASTDRYTDAGSVACSASTARAAASGVSASPAR